MPTASVGAGVNATVHVIGLPFGVITLTVLLPRLATNTTPPVASYEIPKGSEPTVISSTSVLVLPLITSTMLLAVLATKQTSPSVAANAIPRGPESTLIVAITVVVLPLITLAVLLKSLATYTSPLAAS